MHHEHDERAEPIPQWGITDEGTSSLSAFASERTAALGATYAEEQNPAAHWGGQ